MSLPRRVLRPFRKGLARLGVVAPRFALRIADSIGFAKGLFRGTARRRLGRLRPSFSTRECWSVIAHASASEQRNRLISGSVLHDRARVHSLVRAELAPVPDHPVVFAAFHAGPLLAFDAYLARLPRPCYVSIPGSTPAEGTKDFVLAVRALERGESVMIAADVRRGNAVRAPFFEREILFGRGSFALARHAGVPLRPVFLVWRGFDAHVVLGEEITVSATGDRLAAEAVAAARVARWLQDHLTLAPADISLRILAITEPPRSQRGV